MSNFQSLEQVNGGLAGTGPNLLRGLDIRQPRHYYRLGLS